MEITIKTADEFRDSHVTINVTAADSNKAGRVVTRLIGSRLYTAEEVGEAQYGEAELVAAPLRKKIAELEGQLAQSRELVTFKTGVIDALQGDVEKFEANTDRKIAELEADIHRRQMASTQLHNQINELEADITRRVENARGVESQLAAAQQAREIETKRAEENREWAQREQETADRALKDLKAAKQQVNVLRDQVAQRPSRSRQVISADLIEANRVIRQIAGIIARPGTREAINVAPDEDKLADALTKIIDIADGHLQGVADQT